jgi:hypothetical protein
MGALGINRETCPFGRASAEPHDSLSTAGPLLSAGAVGLRPAPYADRAVRCVLGRCNFEEGALTGRAFIV